MKKASSLCLYPQTTHSACLLAFLPVCLFICGSVYQTVRQTIYQFVSPVLPPSVTCSPETEDRHSLRVHSCLCRGSGQNSAGERWYGGVCRVYICAYVYTMGMVGVALALDRASVSCELVKAEIECLDWSIIILASLWMHHGHISQWCLDFLLPVKRN